MKNEDLKNISNVNKVLTNKSENNFTKEANKGTKPSIKPEPIKKK